MTSRPQLKLPDPVVDVNDPWSDDRLERKNYAPLVTGVVEDEENPFVIAVNGRWGCGKTFFLTRWRQSLVNDKWSAVYFDAWQDDFLEDPLLAMIGQLHHHLHVEYSKMCASVKRGAVDFFKRAGKIGLMLANGYVENKFGANAVESVKSGASEIGLCVDEYHNFCKYRAKLVERIGALAVKVFEETHKPLVIIVDELDRCRPVYAVAVLERIKHLFHLPHVVFVLGVDKEQLSNTLKSVYGDIDVDNYLRRFIDLDFTLPEPARDQFVDFLWEQYKIDPWFTEFDDQGFCLSECKDFSQVFKLLARWNNLELREIESAMKTFMIFVRTAKPNHYSWPILAAVMIVLKLRDKTLYAQYVAGRAGAKDVIDALTMYCDIRRDDSDWACLAILKVIYATYTNGKGENPEVNMLKHAEQHLQMPKSEEKYPRVILNGEVDLVHIGEIWRDALRLNSSHQRHSSYDASSVAIIARRIENFKVQN